MLSSLPGWAESGRLPGGGDISAESRRMRISPVREGVEEWEAEGIAEHKRKKDTWNRLTSRGCRLHYGTRGVERGQKMSLGK